MRVSVRRVRVRVSNVAVRLGYRGLAGLGFRGLAGLGE